MSTYRVGIGANIALGSLSVVNPQPRCEGLEFTRRTVFSNSSVVDEGLFLNLQWNVFEDIAQYQAVLTAFGINTLKSAVVTIYAPNDIYTWTRYNGVAIRPQVSVSLSRNNYFIRDVKLLVRELVAI